MTQETVDDTQDRVQAFLGEQLERMHAGTDRMFAGLLAAEYAAGILIATLVSPLTWNGVESEVHPHVWAATLLGLAITGLPVFMVLRRPGQELTRHVVAVGQMLFSALLIHLTGGRLETHFCIFGSLAFLAFYRDWRVLITASIVIAADHALRGAFWPESVYGVAWAPWWRSLEHAAWVVFEDTFLLISIRHSLQEMKDIAARQIELETLNAATEQKVVDRTRDLEESRQQLVKAHAEAVKLAQAKAEFLANMSHEIRTPLNAIVGMTGLLMDTPLEVEQKEFAMTVQHASENLLEIINDILDFSKIEAGKLSLEAVDFDVRELLEESVQLIALRAQAKGLELLSSVSEDIRCGVSGDPGRLRQVLVNLLSNAVKFTEKGEIVLKASREVEDGGRITVLFEVKDTGIGMSPEVQGRIFQAFTQADASTTRRYGGTGLGLAISRRIIDLMGGQIGVRSVLGEGATFWARITFDTRLQQAQSRPIALASRRVLIVDDNSTNRDILRRQLAVWGMSCEEAASGADAVRVALRSATEGRPFQLAIIDMRMPEMDGFDLARCLKREPALRGLPTIMMSSLDQRPDREILTEAGILSCLIKPVRQSVLLDAVVTALAGRGEATAVQAHAQSEPMPRTGLRVLVVEDNSVNQRVALLQLKKLGHEADAVANGLEALEAMDRIPYGLVFMDCHMPEMDGFAATREIRKRELNLRRTPIIAMTANALEGDREKCLAAGMDDYISKPVKPQDLARILQRWESPVDSKSMEDLRELVDHDTTAFAALVKQYFSNMDDLLVKLREATSVGEAAKIEDLGHTLKGSSAHFGARFLMNLCQQMETAARAGRVAGAKTLLVGIEEEAARVRKALEVILPMGVAS